MALAEKGPDGDMLRQMVQFAALRLMDMAAETLCGAGYYEKSCHWLMNTPPGIGPSPVPLDWR